MSASSAFAREIATELLNVLKTDPSAAKGLREALGLDEIGDGSEPKWVTIAAFAKRTGFSRRTIERYLKSGLPAEGNGPARRIDVERADAWLRIELGRKAGDPISEEAEAAARGAAAADKKPARHLKAVEGGRR